jgi:hypothetical protein
MLQLPITVRVPLPAEAPHRTDIEEILEKRMQANIREGYTIRSNETRQLPFSFYGEININNSRLWDLFIALAEMFPAEISCVYGLYESEAVTTRSFPKAAMLKILLDYRQELTQDCFLEFGILYHTRHELIEIFVSESKYIRYWGSDRNSFLQCMKEFGLSEIPRLAFIDDYPKIVEPLKKFIPTARKPEEVVRGLDKEFNIVR